jgi:hypothetical protein
MRLERVVRRLGRRLSEHYAIRTTTAGNASDSLEKAVDKLTRARKTTRSVLIRGALEAELRRDGSCSIGD